MFVVTYIPKLISKPIVDPAHKLAEAAGKMRFLREHNDVWCAGGSSTKLAMGVPLGSSDIDLFFKSKEVYLRTLGWFTKNFEYFGYQSHEVRNPAFHQFYSYPAGVTIQMITSRFYESQEHLLSDFDFTVCQFLTDGVKITGSEEAWEDVGRKILRTRGPTRKTLFRVAKYCRLGFVPAVGLYSAIIDAIPEKNVSNGLRVGLDADAY